MLKKTLSLLMACLFLGSSTLLPLGDFSLMRDLPDMYHNYTKITTAEELGLIDFIGDYLLHGKEIFGNNEHDKPATGNNTVQFQHHASSLNVVFAHVPVVLLSFPKLLTFHPLFGQPFRAAGYRDELFRPPLVWLSIFIYKCSYSPNRTDILSSSCFNFRNNGKIIVNHIFLYASFFT
jgi:hypothetical protein